MASRLIKPGKRQLSDFCKLKLLKHVKFIQEWMPCKVLTVSLTVDGMEACHHVSSEKDVQGAESNTQSHVDNVLRQARSHNYGFQSSGYC